MGLVPYLKHVSIKNILLSVLILISGFFSLSSFSDESLSFVIAHPQSDIAGLNKRRLKAIFTMRVRQWPNGDAISVYVLNTDSSTHKNFVINRLGIFPYQLTREWNRLVYSGFGVRPDVVSNVDEMLERILSNPGAIGYTHNLQRAKSMGLKVYE